MLNIYEFITWTKEERQAHLDLSTPCVYRGTNSTECRGLLAHALNTTVPRGVGIHCCHACHDGKCSNWRHLYWGTIQENIEDAISVGTLHMVRTKSGPENPMYGIAPWRAPSARREYWGLAADIYDDYSKNNWSFESYGKQQRFMAARYNISPRTARNLSLKFRTGWVPQEDPDWLEDFELNTYGI